MGEAYMESKEIQTTQLVTGAGSLAEGIAGGATLILAIVGLAGVYPTMLLAVAIIAAGAAMMVQGGAVGARYSAILSEVSQRRTETAELGGGMTVEFVGGVCAIILGILSLLSIYPAVLLPIGAIVLGGTLVMAGGVTSRLRHLQAEQWTHESHRRVADEAISASAGAEALIGFGAVTLGILGLVGILPIILTLVAALAVGFAGLMSGSLLGGRLLSVFAR